MTLPSITTIPAGQLSPAHLGHTVAFYDGHHRHVGRLEAIYTPKHWIRTLTVAGHRFHDVPSSREVDILIDGEDS